MSDADFPANPIDKPGYRLEFAEDFRAEAIDETRWVPYYLPHWSSRVRSRARTGRRDGRTVLQIEAGQPAWAPEWDGELRATLLQTGLFAGPVGSTVGQLHFRDDLVVREEQPTTRTYTPQFAFVELRARAIRQPDAMVALWLMGVEDQPDRCGEICVAEIFGDAMDDDSAAVGMGIHPFADNGLVEEFSAARFPIDATAFHVYAIDWTPSGVDFYLDNWLVKRTHQSPGYPMQLMLGVYEFPDRRAADVAALHPKQFVIDYVRGYSATAPA